MKICVNTGDHGYDILIQNGIMNMCGEHMPFNGGARLAVVSDENVFTLYGERVTKSLGRRYNVSRFVVPGGETSKSMDALGHVLAFFAETGLTRSDAVVALGGGVVGDLAGFAASVWLRGVRFVQMPTTLLSMTDSSIGGKTGINLPSAKNVVGAFHQPSLVLIDPETLETLPAREYASGMAEIIKHALIRDKWLFERLLALTTPITPELLAQSIAVKRDVVQRDPLEKGERRLLNFGHTLGHAVEQSLGYGEITHGEGVAIGMLGAARLGESLGITKPGTEGAIREILAKFSLPCAPLKRLSIDGALMLDKKRLGAALHLILLREIGDAISVELPAENVAALLKETNEWML